MANRFASLTDCKNFLKGGQAIAKGTEQETALAEILDGVSGAMEQEILGSPHFDFKQAQKTEKYGTEHYGRHGRARIRLRRFPVVSIDEIDDDGTILAATEYDVDSNAAVIYRTSGKFVDKMLGVSVKYTAGFAETGTGDARRLAVPDVLRRYCLEAVAFEFAKREPGGPMYGATSVVRPDGSVVIEASAWPAPVRRGLNLWKR